MELEKNKSEQRIRYETEVEAIRRRFGDIEDIRLRLNLSQRRMAELLLVDPSAWTRWVKGAQPPAYVYRALGWYLELHDRDQTLKPLITRTAQIGIEGSGGQSEANDKLKDEMRSEVESLKNHYESQLRVTFGWKLFLIMNTFAVLYLIFSS